MDELAERFLKNYQVWHHRRLLLQRGALAKSPAAELAFIARGLAHDAKNYHTWAYRQWILAHFNQDALWEGEMRYIENMLEDDVRNNSVWHHRFFVIFSSGVRKGDEDREEVVRRELSFTKEKIALAPNNASAWNYLRGVLEHSGTPFASLKDFALPYTLPAQPPLDSGKDDSVVDLENPRPSSGADLPCPAAIEFLADIHEAAGDDRIQDAIKVGFIKQDLRVSARIIFSFLSNSCGSLLQMNMIPYGSGTFLLSDCLPWQSMIFRLGIGSIA